jgi:ribosomal 50S subunit-associated protein YjgA (DUF615 family)
MTELKENQLLLLDNLIYLKGVAVEGEKDTPVAKIIERLLDRGDLEKSRDMSEKDPDKGYPAEISGPRWREILTNIKNDPALMSLTVTNAKDQIITKTINGEVHQIGGMRAACFVDASGGATVVFRGTSGAYEWHDNGQGGYLPDTVQQKAALGYIEGLKDYNNITVTGHSKGGNKAQYVAIMSSKIDRCVSFDGQGFSKEFIDEYKDKIAANCHKITSISASSDYVNCLLFPVSGTQRYIETESEGEDFLHFHCPDIMLKTVGDFGVLREDTEQSATSKLINKFTQYVMLNVEEPERSYVINGLVAKLEGKDSDESPEQQEKSLEMLKAIGVDFLKKELSAREVVEILGDNHLHEFISKKYGLVADSVAILILADIIPLLFVKDLAKALISDFKEVAGIALENLKKLGNFIIEKIEKFGNKLMDIADGIGKALCKFAVQVKEAWGKLQVYVTGLANDIVNTGIAVGVAIDNFKNKVTSAVSNFFTNVANGVKRFIAMSGKVIVNTLDSAMDKATKGVDRIINVTRDEVKKQYEAFKEGTNHLVTYAKETLDNFGEKGVSMVRNFSKKVVIGMASYTSTRLSVDLFRLAELQSKVRYLESNYFGEKVYQILNEANRITSDVDRNYSEYYVQQQVRSVNLTCDNIRESNRRVCDALQRKTNSLRYALAHYKQIEDLLCTDIIV